MSFGYPIPLDNLLLFILPLSPIFFPMIIELEIIESLPNGVKSSILIFLLLLFTLLQKIYSIDEYMLSSVKKV